MDHSVAIIGRGIAGMAAAFRFALAGISTVVVGPVAVPGSATQVAQGLVTNKGLILARDPLYGLKLRGQRQLGAWLSDIERFAKMSIPRAFVGAVEPFWSESEYLALRSRIYKMQFDGFTANEVWTKQQIEKSTAASLLAPGAIGGFYYPFDGWFDPQATLLALERAARTLGVSFVEEPCVRIAFDRPGVRVQLESTAPLLVGDVVMAAGYFCKSILDQSGLPSQMLRPVLGLNMLLPRTPTQNSAIPVVHGLHSLVTTDQHLILGSSSSLGDWSSPSQDTLASNAEQLTQVAANFTAVLPELRAGASHRWGVRLNATDRRPVVGFCDYGGGRRLGFLTALYKSGLLIADQCAQQLLEAYQSGKPTSHPLLRPDRFFQRH